MADYYQEQTLPAAEQAIAQYYAQGPAAHDPKQGPVVAMAGQGRLDLPELSEAAEKVGLDRTIAEVRRDTHPLVAAALGLDPQRAPTNAEVAEILGGRRADGTAQPGAHRDKTVWKSSDGDQRKDKIKVSSVDFTFSMDKSWSVAWALSGLEDRAAIHAIHREAAERTLAYMESQLARIKEGGERVAGGHFTWMAFDHYTSRPTVDLRVAGAGPGEVGTAPHKIKDGASGDPNVHTHFIVPNMVLMDDGRVGSLDLSQAHGRVKEWGAVYQAFVATLGRERGANVRLGREGQAELRGLPDHVRRHFSKRTENGEIAARELASKAGLDWDALPDDARRGLVSNGVHGTKRHKDGELANHASWVEQAARIGHRQRDPFGGPARALGDYDRRMEVAFRAANWWLEDELTRRAVLDNSDVRVAAARGLVEAGIAEAGEVSVLTKAMRDRGVSQHGERTKLRWAKDQDGKVRITTDLHLDQERDFLALVSKAMADRSQGLSDADFNRHVATVEAAKTAENGRPFEFTDAQRTAMLHLARDGGQFAAVRGAAGVGKSTMLAPLVAAWHEQGRAVFGTAIANRNADDLKEAGVVNDHRIRSLAAFIWKAERGHLIGLNERSVVLLDEFGQVGTRQGLALKRLRERIGFKVVTVGDDKQPQPVEAGSVLGLLRDEFGEKAVPEVTQTIRQRRDRDKEIAGLFRQGEAAKALAMKREDSTAEMVPGSRQDAIRRVAALWRERKEALGPEAELTVSAPTNADARDISLAIREERRSMGDLGPDVGKPRRAIDQRGEKYDLPLAVGDRVRLFDTVGARSEGGPGGVIGRNGTIVEVRGIRDDGLLLRSPRGREGFVPWEKLRDEETGRIRLGPGEVRTINAATGSTVHEHINALVSGTQAVNAFLAYPAESRNRETTWMVLSEGVERRQVASKRPLNDPRGIHAADLWENAAKNLSRQPEKANATAFLRGARDQERKAQQRLIVLKQRMARNKGEGREPLTLAQTLRQQRDERAVEAASRQVEMVLERLGKAGPVIQRPGPAPAPEFTAPGVNSVKLPKPAAPSAAEVEAARKALWNEHLNEVRAALRNNAAGVAEAVAGKPDQRGRTDWRYGAKGALKITVAGPGAGLWHDHESGRGGDMLALIQHRHGGGFGQAVAWAREHLGVPAPDFAKGLTDADRARMAARGGELAAEKARADAAAEAAKLSRQETVARRSAIVWAGSKPATADHPYLARKGVDAEGLRLDRRGRLRVPMRDMDGKLWGLQTIDAHGTKLFPRGGRVGGTFFMAGEADPGRPVAFAEGVATAKSVRAASGLPVAATFSVGNKERVVAEWRARNPGQTLIDAADNDHGKTALGKRNAGREMAERLARDHGAVPALPPWKGHEAGSDWNDYAKTYGKAAAAEAFRAAVASPSRDRAPELLASARVGVRRDGERRMER